MIEAWRNRSLFEAGGIRLSMIDRLMWLVSVAAGAPTAFAALAVGYGPTVLAARGLDDVKPGDQLPLPPPIRREILTSGIPLIVEDAAQDRRFAGHQTWPMTAFVIFPVRDETGAMIALAGVSAPWASTWSPRHLASVDNGAELLGSILTSRV